MLTSAYQNHTSALTGLLICAVPLVGVVIATSLGNREHLGLASLSGLLLGLVGVALIVGFDLRASNLTALVEMAVRFDARDRKSTRLNSSHVSISYAVFCLKKKKNDSRARDPLRRQ